MKARAPRSRGRTGIPATLWRRVAAAPHLLLMLDYDGTLAPYRRDRDRARPAPVTLERVRALSQSGRTTLAIVSGRPLDEIAGFIRLPSVSLIGEHGWDERRTGHGRIRHPLPRAAAAALRRAESAARGLGWGRYLERKRTALVLHTRGLPARRARAIESQARAAWTPAAQGDALVLGPTLGGVELRARGRNKGTIARSLIADAPPETLAVFVGDDLTDEDAFAVVREHGFGVRVGADRRKSQATARLPDCVAVTEFLGRWLRMTSG